MLYQVVDQQAGFVMGTYQTRWAARHAANRLDIEYGAIRYAVVEAPENERKA